MNIRMILFGLLLFSSGTQGKISPRLKNKIVPAFLTSTAAISFLTLWYSFNAEGKITRDYFNHHLAIQEYKNFCEQVFNGKMEKEKAVEYLNNLHYFEIVFPRMFKEARDTLPLEEKIKTCKEQFKPLDKKMKKLREYMHYSAASGVTSLVGLVAIAAHSLVTR